MQDRVIVIYSVDMLPDSTDASLLDDCAAWADEAHGLICQWDQHCAQRAKGTLDATGWSTGLHDAGAVQGSQCRPVGAWGRVSYGMRVAIMSASDITSAAMRPDGFTIE